MMLILMNDIDIDKFTFLNQDEDKDKDSNNHGSKNYPEDDPKCYSKCIILKGVCKD